MASRSTQIPRFLLPQNGPAWRAAATRSGAFSRPFAPEQAQLLVRYATTAAKPKPAAAKTVTKAVPKSAAKITTKAAPKAAAAKPATTKVTTKTTAKTTTTTAKATAAKPATKTAAAAATTKTVKAASPAATPKTPASKPVLPPQAATPAAASPPRPPAAPSPANPVKTAPASTSQPTAAAAAEAAPATPASPASPEAGVSGSLPASLAADRAGPIILEQPDAFRPPSHGKRLPRAMPKHYGGGPTAEEIQAQRAKQYPGMPPPENTWSHWFINSRGIHLFITLGTLSGLAVYTFAINFNDRSQFAHLIPPISEFPRHPFQYIGVCIDVLKMHEEHESAITAEKRRQKIEDVAKRNEFRKAHGLEPASGVAPWASKQQPQPEPEPEAQTAGGVLVGSNRSSVSDADAGPTTLAETGQFTEEGKRKKFLGIF
ncbi:hypothetical protein Micbo1qcDRAFT_155957 [Microdochium bolleyi]|uniref:Uncharacterized protein n=1 Tax=Microdochium bolleyi TaxID=196109 RepID=A0A136JJ13_9PEZI|nr:hypothetical protein Micbo1qcDRAFT_155957 [Microdochium bolleyi]